MGEAVDGGPAEKGGQPANAGATSGCYRYDRSFRGTTMRHEPPLACGRWAHVLRGRHDRLQAP